MKNKVSYTFEQDLEKRLKNPAFKKEWEKSETEYQLARDIIKKRLELKLSQRALAKKMGTSQVVISRLETMEANPSLALLKRLAFALQLKLKLGFE